MAFRTFADVDNWLARPGQTMGVLRGMLTSGVLAGENAKVVRAWLDQYDALSEAGRRDREMALLQASADAAQKQAKWAGWSLVVSIAALLVSAWTFIQVNFQ